MAWPALLLPEDLMSTDLAPEIANRLHAHKPEWAALLTRFRTQRPPDGSPEERTAILDYLRLVAAVQADLGVGWTQVLRGGVDRALRRLVENELAAAEIERKFALRQLEQALRTYGELVEFFAQALADVPEDALARLSAEAAEELSREDASIDPIGARVARWGLDLLVSFEVLGGPVEELALWAQRAVVGSRKVAALMAGGALAGMGGDLARLRARRSWDGWDDDEIRGELAPWPRATS